MRHNQILAGVLVLLLVGAAPAVLHAQFPAPPSNDSCANAITGLTVPSVTAGSTDGATVDTQAPNCGSAQVTSPGVWYTVVGTGRVITADTCTGTSYDSKLSAYCTDCSSFQCITGNDDACGLQSQISWCSQLGATYHILVHGFGGANGPFELTLTDGGACDTPVPCAESGPQRAPVPVLSRGMVAAMAFLLLGLGLFAVRRRYRT